MSNTFTRDVRRQNVALLATYHRLGLVDHSIVAVYNAVLHFTNYRSDHCRPSHDAIAKQSGYSVSTVIRRLNDLRDLRFLSWARRWQRWNKRDSNLYTMHPVDSAKAKYPQRRKSFKSLDKSLSVTVTLGSAPTDPERAELAAYRLAYASQPSPLTALWSPP